MNNKLANFAPLLFLAFASRAAVPYGAAPQQTGDLLLPSGEITAATPKILLIHGGGWTSEKYLRGTLADEAALFRDAGFAVYNIDYRLAPNLPPPRKSQSPCSASRLAGISRS